MTSPFGIGHEHASLADPQFSRRLYPGRVHRLPVSLKCAEVAKAEPPAEIIAVLQRQFDEHHKQAQEGGKG
jgi:hypothetical protein